ncbi:MAG: hypothetical protein RL133_1243, partial [Pseudomonadota bacterium]
MIELQVSRGLQVEGRFCFPDSEESIRLGKADDSDITLSGLSVAKRHCELRRGRSGWILMDTGSLSGTRVNQRAVQEYGPLKIGDQIDIGPWRLSVMGTQVSDTPLHMAPGRPLPVSAQERTERHAQSIDESSPQDKGQLRRALLKLRTALERRRREWSSMSDEALRLETAELAEAIALDITDLEPSTRSEFVQRLVAESVGFGPLEPLLSDPTVTEIMVNGPSTIFVERGGRCERATDAFSDAQSL